MILLSLAIYIYVSVSVYLSHTLSLSRYTHTQTHIFGFDFDFGFGLLVVIMIVGLVGCRRKGLVYKKNDVNSFILIVVNMAILLENNLLFFNRCFWILLKVSIFSCLQKVWLVLCQCFG